MADLATTKSNAQVAFFISVDTQTQFLTIKILEFVFFLLLNVKLPLAEETG